MTRITLICAAMLLAVPASAGDYAVLDCKAKTLIVMSMPDHGEGGFCEWRQEKNGEWRCGRELPRRHFRVMDHGDRVYYRGKRCVELEQ